MSKQAATVLSSSQKDFIVFDSIWPGAFLGPDYTIIESGIFDSDPGKQAIEDGIASVTDRHQALRMVLQRCEDADFGFQMVYESNAQPTITTPIPSSVEDSEIGELNRLLSNIEIALTGSQLSQWMYQPLEGNRAFLGCAFHHMSIDGRSAWEVLRQVASHVLDAPVAEAPQFDEYCTGQTAKIDDPGRASKRNKFWSERYAWEPAFDLPTHFPAQKTQATCETVRIDLPTDLTQHESNGKGLRPFSIYCAAAMLVKQAVMLPHPPPDASLSTNAVGSLRESAMPQPVGPVFRIFPIIVERSLGEYSLAGFGELVQRRWLEAWQEADAPMHHIGMHSNDDSRRDRSNAHQDGCPMLFQMAPSVPPVSTAKGQFHPTPSLIAPVRRTWGIEAMISPAERQRELVLSYDPGRFPESCMQAMAKMYLRALDALLHRPDHLVQDTLYDLAGIYAMGGQEPGRTP